ncbi:MAG: RDD family protein [Opitutaceae bacterium]
MFTIIGGDGKEYGPATTSQVRGWLNGGRANADTRAKRVGAEEWRRLGDFVEFGGVEVAAPARPVPEGDKALSAVLEAEPETLASPWSRLLARCADGFLEVLAAVPALVVLGPDVMKVLQAIVAASREGEFNLEGLETTRLMPALALFTALQLALLGIQIFLLTSRGQTLGKILLGVRVVRAGDGEKPGFLRAWLLRELPSGAIQGMLQLVPIVGFFLRFAFVTTNYLMIFREDRRCLHDFIAGTRVVRA